MSPQSDKKRVRDHFFVAGYWGSRREPLGTCAKRARRMFQELENCDPIFSRWCEFVQRGKAWRERAVNVTEAELARTLTNGRNRRDVDGAVIPELGFSLGLSTPGPRAESAHLSVLCGSFSPYVGNDCLMKLPIEGASATRLLQVGPLTKILNAIAESWNPDWGVVTSNELLEKQGALGPGWLTYLRNRPASLGALPLPSRVVGMKSGVLVVLTEEPVDANNPSHLELVSQLAAALPEAKPRP